MRLYIHKTDTLQVNYNKYCVSCNITKAFNSESVGYPKLVPLPLHKMQQNLE